jgi:hypothetical protein
VINVTKRKGEKNRGINVALAVALGIILMLLILLDINLTSQKSMTLYRENQDVLAKVMMERAIALAQDEGSELSDNIVSNIKDNFPTSSSMYCIFARNDEIVYLKDDNTTSTIINERLSNYFNTDNISSRDNKKYIVSKTEAEYNGEDYALAICTRQNYLEKRININEIRLHCLGYFLINGAMLLVIIVFAFYKLHSQDSNIKSLEEEVKKNRLIIEQLENDKNKNYVNSEKEEHYSFYDRNIVDEVIACMSQEDKENCIQIDIFVENLKMEHFVLITAILGRIKEGNSVACYWEENQFKVLLFHSDKEDVQAFINLFIAKYKSESKEKVEDLRIVATSAAFNI